ncbi:hypothetical protein ACQJBY_048931 [Aegilops geniculata]
MIRRCTNPKTRKVLHMNRMVKLQRKTVVRLEVGTEDLDLSKEDLVKLVFEKDELLTSKDEEIKDMKDKVLRSYAEMENVIARTKRESENSKKYAVQNFSKSLLDVADNLARASSVVKESFSKLDTSEDSSGAVPLLKTLLEGVDMTDKQLGEVFKKFGVERFDPLNEKFDPDKHFALFQIPDPSKPSGTVASVLKVGYMLHDRVLRPAEVGVTEGGPSEEPEEKSGGD